MVKRLMKCIREYKRYTILTPIYVMIEVCFECIIPFVISVLVNKIDEGCDLKTISIYGGIIVVMACLSLLFGYLSGCTCATASCGFAKNLRKDLYYKVQDYSFENIDNFSSSSLVTRLTTDVTNVQMAFMMIIRIAVRSPMMLIFALIMSFILGGKLALVFVAVVPLLAIGLILIIKFALPLFKKVFKKYDKLNESVQENIEGIRVVKTFVREDFEKHKFGKAADDVKDDFTKAEKILAFNTPLMQLCLYIDMIVVLYFGAKIIISTRGSVLNVGQMSGLLTYGFQILMSLMMLSMIFVMITMASESAKRIFEALNENIILKSPDNAVTEVPNGSITFKNVSFKYSKKAEKMALSDINFEIKSGMTVGIIGGTGASKTTLVNLISRLYDTTKGEVLVGGINVKNYDISSLRNQVSVVLQKNVLFSGTINENLKWGDPDATDDEIRKACEISCADEFIQTFPHKYDTYIEQGGTNVSGGQKQRLCIARALLKHPKILILDDSTSAVDTKTDALIRAGFKNSIPDTTKIIIAQRISSVQDSDLIIVLDGGSIAESGTHEELVSHGGIYNDIFESQNRAGVQK